MTEFDDEIAYSDANLFKQIRNELIDALKQNKLKRVDTGAWETAQTGVEYYSPCQQCGIYGTVYRQYFTTALTATNPRVDTGGIVTRLVDFYMRTNISSVYYCIRGSTRGYTSAEADIQLTSGNLALVFESHSLNDGWIDYTK